MVARLVLLSCLLVLAGCQTSLKPHLTTSPDDLTVFPTKASKPVRTSLRFTKEDVSQLTSFPEMVEVLGRFRDGLDCYRDQEWDKALECFEEALAAHPGDTCSQLYVTRCKQLKANPPGPEWTGVWKMTSK